MKPTVTALIIGCLLSFTVADSTVEIDKTKSKVVPKLYEELDCKEIVETKDGFTRFECPDINTRDTNKCHLKGKSYNVSEKAHQDDLPYCTAQCICLQHKDENNENYKPAAFNCAEIECPEHFGGRDWSCVSQYANIRDCCRTNEVCGQAKIEEITKCHVEEKIYKIGERIYPDSEPCYECLCADGFDNKTEISKNPNCIRVDCGIELRDLGHVRDGCIPIYFENRCCPIEFKCPSDDDIILPASGMDSTNTTSEFAKCKFGKLTMKLGDKLKTDKCTTCECSMPPFASCIKTNKC